MKTSEVLTTARAEVARGWTQGDYVDDGGNMCAVGALYRAFGVEPWTIYADSLDHHSREFGSAERALRDSLREFGSFINLPAFNDDENTAQQDVLNLFTKAILSCRERGE